MASRHYLSVIADAVGVEPTAASKGTDAAASTLRETGDIGLRSREASEEGGQSDGQGMHFEPNTADLVCCYRKAIELGRRVALCTSLVQQLCAVRVCDGSNTEEGGGAEHCV